MLEIVFVKLLHIEFARDVQSVIFWANVRHDVFGMDDATAYLISSHMRGQAARTRPLQCPKPPARSPVLVSTAELCLWAAGNKTPAACWLRRELRTGPSVMSILVFLTLHYVRGVTRQRGIPRRTAYIRIRY